MEVWRSEMPGVSIGTAKLRRRRAAAVLALAAATFGGVAAAASGPAQAAGSHFTVRLASASGVGKVLVDGAGKTLYIFSSDKNGKPHCTSVKCAAYWPALTVAKGKTPTAGAGLNSKWLGTVKDPNGKMQVTYDHKPLYLFAGDSKPGQANGEGLVGFGGSWSTMNAKGQSVAATTTTTTTTSGGGTSSTTTTTMAGSTTTTTTGTVPPTTYTWG